MERVTDPVKPCSFQNKLIVPRNISFLLKTGKKNKNISNRLQKANQTAGVSDQKP